MQLRCIININMDRTSSTLSILGNWITISSLPKSTERKNKQKSWRSLFCLKIKIHCRAVGAGRWGKMRSLMDRRQISHIISSHRLLMLANGPGFVSMDCVTCGFLC